MIPGQATLFDPEPVGKVRCGNPHCNRPLSGWTWDAILPDGIHEVCAVCARLFPRKRQRSEKR